MVDPAQERDHLRGVVSRMARTQDRTRARLALAKSFAWVSADGTLARITRIDDVWCVDLDDQPHAVVSTEDEAFACAVAAAPPADSDLAALLTWTACGRSRV